MLNDLKSKRIEMDEERRSRDLEEERLAIIAKYDLGRGEGAEIYPWEDPAYEIYHNTDHYGYIQ